MKIIYTPPVFHFFVFSLMKCAYEQTYKNFTTVFDVQRTELFQSFVVFFWFDNKKSSEPNSDSTKSYSSVKHTIHSNRLFTLTLLTVDLLKTTTFTMNEHLSDHYFPHLTQ